MKIGFKGASISRWKPIIIWVLTVAYLLFIIYISTTNLPPEEPIRNVVDNSGEDGSNGGDPGNGGASGSGDGTSGDGSSGESSGGGRGSDDVEGPNPFFSWVYSLREDIYRFDFYANTGLYAVLGALLILAWTTVAWIDKLGGLGLAFLTGTGLSMTMELVQSWLDRVSDPGDIVANAIGTLLGALIVFVIMGYLQKRSEKD